MTKLKDIYLQIEPIIYQQIWKDFYKELMSELQELRQMRSQQNQPQIDENWLTPEQFCDKFRHNGNAIFAPEYLGMLRTNCMMPVQQQKFYKYLCSKKYAYNPLETFRYIMRLPGGKTKIQNRIKENNFFGFKMEDEQCPAK